MHVPVRPPFASARPLVACVLVMALIGLAGCATSQPPEPSASPTPPPTPRGPHFTLLYVNTDGALVRHATASDSMQVLATGIDSLGARALSPDRQTVAFSYAANDSTHLVTVDGPGGPLRAVHAHPGPATYTLAWHPADGRLAFAYYTPSASGQRGPGDVRILLPDETVRRVGCRAAREVLHWLPSDDLAARDDRNLYIVSATDCATQASFDARRMHLAAYSADGQHLAYIHRELEYNRAARAYQPDSTLILGGPDGQDSDELFGDERAPRHMRWAPEAPELALDARLDEASNRQVVIYNAVQDRIVYFIPPGSPLGGDQLYPRWSPSGNHLAITLQRTDGAVALTRVNGQTRTLGPTTGPIAGWVSDQTLALHSPAGLRLVDLNGRDQYALDARVTYLHGWAVPPAAQATTD